MLVLQCWDDGVTTDLRLTEILRRHGATATFNLNAGLHGAVRGHGWTYRGTEVRRLARQELAAVYEGFTIANHTLTHPHLDELPLEQARREIAEGRERLQQWFGQPVSGFAYPFGTFNAAVESLVQEAGHVYARTVETSERPFPPDRPMALRTNGHVLSPALWERYEQAKSSGVFYFWGHSYELIDEGMWASFEDMIRRISADPEARWGEIVAAVTDR